MTGDLEPCMCAKHVDTIRCTHWGLCTVVLYYHGICAVLYEISSTRFGPVRLHCLLQLHTCTYVWSNCESAHIHSIKWVCENGCKYPIVWVYGIHGQIRILSRPLSLVNTHTRRELRNLVDKNFVNSYQWNLIKLFENKALYSILESLTSL